MMDNDIVFLQREKVDMLVKIARKSDLNFYEMELLEEIEELILYKELL